ncbi:MAG TPA: malto-oligosyltrehalose synthase [Steroidobacteraceae bacterium]|nr:malto-oligosyltrehalose synthase [Steroidobacteraceae bacterium]
MNEAAAPSGRRAIIPRATYRLQLNGTFTFRDATALIPYLAALGISHVYCSPYFRARPGSMHGYDVVDHNALNPEIGTEADFEEFVATLRAHGMGHIVDFVPNHVGIMGAENAAWMDVLEHGQDSKFAEFFDIDWQPPTAGMAGKILVPVLGSPYGESLEKGELQLRYEPETHSLAVFYHQHRFPIDSRTYPPGPLEDVPRELNGTPGDPRSFDKLHDLLERQSYRLAYWRVAADNINYRRFFDVNDLAALRMENPQVFATTHRLLLQLIAEGKLDGVRIDHPDGLYDPHAYFETLQSAVNDGAPCPADKSQLPLYLIVEKILATFERLPQSWPVHGTTGYNFTNLVSGVFVDARAKARLDRIYSAFIVDYAEWADVAFDSKVLVLGTSLAAELNVLANQLARIAEADRHTRDFTLNNLRRVLMEVIACFPVYRTYVTDRASDEDRRFIDWAIARARRRSPSTDEPMLEFVRARLLADVSGVDPSMHAQVRAFAGKFQQVTAPVTAKGVEDTALYRFTRLVSLNEVGGEPETFGTSVRQFHSDAQYRARNWPHEMLTTSTHDTKRAEDVRARINVLSEMVVPWRKAIQRWSRMNRTRRRIVDDMPAPGPHAEYLLYQTLLGTWPLTPLDDEAYAKYRERIEEYMVKASREAKRRTSWANVNAEYEEALRQFIRLTLERREGNLFPGELADFARRLARFGFLNSLAQTLCKLTAPGVPDIYQGNEIWDDSLVDPDNRRPVDYDLRRRLLADVRDWTSREQLQAGLDSLEDGRCKLFVTFKTLELRRGQERLFRDGAYVPLTVSGASAQHVLAFARRADDQLAIVAVPRLSARLLGWREALPLGAGVWGETRIDIPPRVHVAEAGPLRNVLTGETIELAQDDAGIQLVVASVFSSFPVALLVRA